MPNNSEVLTSECFWVFCFFFYRGGGILNISLHVYFGGMSIFFHYWRNLIYWNTVDKRQFSQYLINFVYSCLYGQFEGGGILDDASN